MGLRIILRGGEQAGEKITLDCTVSPINGSYLPLVRLPEPCNVTSKHPNLPKSNT